jgi:hypothetical protein
MRHLSSEQISEWLLGERNAEVGRHVEICGKCREEIVQMQDGLHAFKETVHGWAERPQAWNIPARKPSPASWSLVAATAVAMSLVLLPLYLNVRQAQFEAEKAQDSLLLDQVQERLNQTVPQSMERLMELMSERKEAQQ